MTRLRLLIGILLTLGFCVSFSAIPRAQFAGAFWGSSAPACGGNTFLGDTVGTGNFALEIGLRAFSAATCGNALIDIQRNSDSTTCTNIKSLSTTGALDVSTGTPCAGSTTVTSWCNATTCTITKFHDQSTNGRDYVQSTVAKQATLTLNCVNSQPCATTTSTTQYSTGAGLFYTVNQPLSTVFFGEQTSSGGFAVGLAGDTGPSVYAGFSSANNNIHCYINGTTKDVALTDGIFASVETIAHGTSSTCVLNSSATAFSAGTSGISGQPFGTGSNFTGKFTEIAILTIDNTTNLSAVSTNQNNFW